MTKTRIAAVALSCALVGGLAAPGFAAGSGENQEAAAFKSAKVTLPQAIATAEQQTGGKAFDAGVDSKSGKVNIVVETDGPKGVQTVTLDGQSGQVIGTHAGGETD